MNRVARILASIWVGCLALATSLAWSAPIGSPIAWRSNFPRALAEARASGKLVLVNTHTEWCGYCKQLEQTTLRDPKLVRFINENCIPVTLDGDLERELMLKWNVQGFPTQIILDRNGKVVDRIVGYKNAEQYAASLLSAVRIAGAVRPVSPARTKFPSERTARPPEFSNPAPTSYGARRTATSPRSQTFGDDLRRPGPSAPPNPRQVSPTGGIGTTARFASSSPTPVPSVPSFVPPTPGISQQQGSAAAPDPRASLALNGYCPVSMIARAVLILGNPSYSEIYQRRRYCFQSAQDRSLFLSDPESYLPAESGRCVVTWRELNESKPGNVEYPAIFEDHVYLFENDIQRRKFLMDPERYVTGRAPHSSRRNLYDRSLRR